MMKMKRLFIMGLICLIISFSFPGFASCMAFNDGSLQYEKIEGKEEYSVVGIGTVSNTSVTIPNTYNNLPVTEISAEAFKNEVSITSVKIGNRVRKIQRSAFNGCSNLTNIEISNSVHTIESLAFQYCTSLQYVTIPKGMQAIGRGAFSNCNKLKGITFTDSLTWYRTTDEVDWKNRRGGTETALTHQSHNMRYFNVTYYNYYWYKL